MSSSSPVPSCLAEVTWLTRFVDRNCIGSALSVLKFLISDLPQFLVYSQDSVTFGTATAAVWCVSITLSGLGRTSLTASPASTTQARQGPSRLVFDAPLIFNSLDLPLLPHAEHRSNATSRCRYSLRRPSSSNSRLSISSSSSLSTLPFLVSPSQLSPSTSPQVTTDPKDASAYQSRFFQSLIHVAVASRPQSRSSVPNSPHHIQPPVPRHSISVDSGGGVHGGGFDVFQANGDGGVDLLALDEQIEGGGGAGWPFPVSSRLSRLRPSLDLRNSFETGRSRRRSKYELG